MTRRAPGGWLGVAVIAVAGSAWLASSAGALDAQQRDQPQSPPRDAAIVRAGTAQISGVVTSDESNGRPVRRVTVQITLSDGSLGQLAITDDQGRFTLTSLAAGRYTLSAAKPGWVRSYYGAKRPWRQPGMAIVVADGQRINNVAVKIVRGAVITGRVRDGQGQPLPGARPMVLELRNIGGVRRLQPVSSAVTLATTTDDRGEYRVFGLPPGNYVVAAAPPPIGSASGFRVTSPADVQWASQLAQPALPGTTAGAGLGPAPPQTTYGYEPTFYPGVSDPSAATTIAVAAGEERTGMDLTIRPVTTAKIAGIVAHDDGLPAVGAQLTLTPENDGITVSSLETTPIRLAVDPAGRFSIPSVRPGRYVLQARVGARVAERPTAAVTGGAATPQPAALWGTTRVVVNGQDVDGLSVVVRPGIVIAGRVTFEATTLTPPADLSRLTVQIMSSSLLRGGPRTATSVLGVPALADGTFVVPGVAPDEYILTAGLVGASSAGWVLKAAMVNGRNALDEPFTAEDGRDIRDVAIVFTDRSSNVSGQLIDAKGQPVAGFHVFVFPTDKAAWSSNSRRFRMPVRPDSSGHYRIPFLPPGEYYIAALTDFEEQDIQDASFIEQIIPAAIKITIAEGEKKVQDIKLAGG